jgi:hypothetical protein
MPKFDMVNVECPYVDCNEVYSVRARLGEGVRGAYDLKEAPVQLQVDLHQGGPYVCPKCKRLSAVALQTIATVIKVRR